jgi:hypothetical protein
LLHFTSEITLRGLSRFVLGVFLFLACSGPASAQLAEGNDRLSLPQSHLDEPFDGAVFLTGHASFGAGYDDRGADIGYGGSLIFRSGASANFFNALFRWNMATVLQVDYQKLDGGGSWTSIDLIMRRHFSNRGDSETEVNLFLGVGTGGSERHLEEDATDDGQRYWTWLVEAGQEWHFKPGFLFLIRGQYRWFLIDSQVDGMWSVQAGLGIRWP